MAAFLPFGYEFEPTTEQLVGYFLKTKLSGQPLPPYYPQFLDYDVYSDHPLNVLFSTKESRGIQDDDCVSGYFFTRLKKTNPKGKRVNRFIKDHGTWSETSKTKKVYDQAMRVIGFEKYYKFIPIEARKNGPLNEDEWKMHEYLYDGNKDLVLCHITKKMEPLDLDAYIRSSLKRSRKNSIMVSNHETNLSKISRVEDKSLEVPSYGLDDSSNGAQGGLNYDFDGIFNECMNNVKQVMPQEDHGHVYERSLTRCRTSLDPFEQEDDQHAASRRLEAFLMS